MTARRLTLVGGGVRSGKSAFALSLARARGSARVFVATAQTYDDEMRARATAHQAEREGEFVTIEEPVHVVERLVALEGVDVVVLDCLTLWLTNLLLGGRTEPAILAEVTRLADVTTRGDRAYVVVTNEVGMGIVPETPLGRAFRDIAGRAHQILAARADEVYLGMLGLRLRVKPGPVVAVDAR